jgi:hypothetical protein
MLEKTTETTTPPYHDFRVFARPLDIHRPNRSGDRRAAFIRTKSALRDLYANIKKRAFTFPVFSSPQ